MPYAYTTLAQTLAALATRLYDPTMTRWTQAELIAYVQEALRTWNALTSSFRGDFLFQTNANVEWTNLSTIAGTIRPFTLTDQSIYSTIEYHLLEPQTPTYPLTWTGSLQFSLIDLMGATQRRLDEILGVTGCTITAHPLIAALPGRTYLPDTVIDIRRVAFIASGQVAPGAGYGLGGYGLGPYGGFQPPWYGAVALWEEDLWSKQAYEPGYTTAAPTSSPKSWLRSTKPPLSFDVYDTVGIPGQFDLLTIEGSTPFSTTAATLLGIPDDWAWVLKWGVLADLLSRESNAKDELRAGYANQRYRQGLALMTDAPAILGMQRGNIPITVDAIRNVDQYNPQWQLAALGPPVKAVVAGQNLVTFAPITDPGYPSPYTMTATVVQNAPVPVATTDFVQVSRDVYDVIVDYAQHLASFKDGGEEFTATSSLYDRFMHEASLYNSRLAEMAQYERTIYPQAERELHANPRYLPGTDVGGES